MTQTRSLVVCWLSAATVLTVALCVPPAAAQATTVLQEEAPVTAGEGAYNTECSNSATGETADLEWLVTGTAPAAATEDSDVTLADQLWSVTVPGAVFDAAIAGGLVAPGDSVSAEASAMVSATNTAEGSWTALKIPADVVLESDADGMALPATLVFAVSDFTFTATGGDVAFSVGGAALDFDLGEGTVIEVTCTPYADQAAFLTVTVPGVSTQVAEEQELAVTGIEDSLVVALALAGLVLVDIGYLTFSTRRPQGRAGD